MEAVQEPIADFITEDLALASFLHMEGYQFSIDCQGRKAWFVFAPDNDLESTVADYRDGVAEVEPRQFTQATGHVRKRMYEALGQTNGRR